MEAGFQTVAPDDGPLLLVVGREDLNLCDLEMRRNGYVFFCFYGREPR